jgi:ribA/ribD-fused uncharacterized protein
MQQTTLYNPAQVITFRKTSEAFGGLSNMAPNFTVQVSGVNFFTVEHLYQVCKFPLFPLIQLEIIKERSPITAKQISRKYDAFVRQDWNEIRVTVMQWVLEIKLSQNWEVFSQLLLSTENKPIVEYTTKDKIWGATPEGNTLVGQNVLGKLLTNLRDQKVINKNREACVDAPRAISAFLLFNNEIGTTCIDDLLAEYAIEDEHTYELQ